MSGVECSVISQKIFGTTSYTDDDLTSVARERGPSSADAVESLLRRYDRLIYRACFSYLRDASLAEEASQEVRIRVHRGISRFQGRSSFRTWLYRIVRNECYSAASHHARHRVCQSLDDDEHPHQALVSSDSMADIELNDAVHVALRRLPPTDQEVIKLRFFYELSIRTIAGQLGTSLSGAKMRLYRAIARFEKAYVGLELDVPVSALP